MAARRWFLVPFLLAVGFALYGSWVPFRFHGPFALSRIGPTLAASLSGGFSRTDFVANVLLFVPIGFMGGGLVAPPRERLSVRFAASLLVLLFAAGVSLLCESVQVFLPARVPSLWDVTAETSGAVCGLVGWLVLGAEVERWLGRFVTGQTGAVWRPWLMLFALGRFLILLYPFDVTINPGELAHKLRAGGVVLNPLRSPALQLAVLPDLIRDAIVAIPVGILACVIGLPLGRRRSSARAFGLAAAAFGAVEAAQVFVLSCRADVFEWAVNTTGAAVGVWLLTWLSDADVERQAARQGRQRLALAGLAASMLLYGVYNWSPFNFHLSIGTMRDRGATLVAMPFYGYWINPEFKAAGEALVKLAIGAPMGVFLYWFLVSSAPAYRRLATAVTTTAVVVFVSIIEVGQVFLPSRYADDTDILLALMGAAAGAIGAKLSGLVGKTE